MRAWEEEGDFRASIEADPEMTIDLVMGGPRDWEPGPTISNNFGFGGHNGSVVFAPAS